MYSWISNNQRFRKIFGFLLEFNYWKKKAECASNITERFFLNVVKIIINPWKYWRMCINSQGYLCFKTIYSWSYTSHMPKKLVVCSSRWMILSSTWLTVSWLLRSISLVWLEDYFQNCPHAIHWECGGRRGGVTSPFLWELNTSPLKHMHTT